MLMMAIVDYSSYLAVGLGMDEGEAPYVCHPDHGARVSTNYLWPEG